MPDNMSPMLNYEEREREHIKYDCQQRKEATGKVVVGKVVGVSHEIELRHEHNPHETPGWGATTTLRVFIRVAR